MVVTDVPTDPQYPETMEVDAICYFVSEDNVPISLI